MPLLQQHGRLSARFVLLAIGVSVALAGAGMAAPPESQLRMASLEQKPMPAPVPAPLINLAQLQSQSLTEHQLNAEERMRWRFPQLVRVGIGACSLGRRAMAS